MTGTFSFPLNVYARVLELREGRVDHLHYGVFDELGEAAGIAQQRASELLWQALPPPCRILEVGIGLGTTLARLNSAGYEASGITPDAGQAEFARRRHGGQISVEVSRLEDFTRDAGHWQAMLFQESGQYIESVALFDAVDRLLHDGPSTLIVMDEFALQRTSDAHQGLHELHSFCAMAQRRGWRLASQLDLSSRARPTLGYLLGSTRDLADRLIADLGVSHEQLAALAESNARYQRLYDEGVYGYALLRFERERRPSDRLCNVSPALAPAMRALFGQVFGQSMSAEHWHWKYGDGRGHGIGLMWDDRMVAHYGGVTRRVMCQGEAVMACQVCDVMVDRAAQAGLARQGPMAQVAASFLETQIGWGLPHRLGFGFPSDRAFGVAQRLGFYTGVDSMTRASWTPGLQASGDVAEELTVNQLAPGGRRRSAVDGLWRQMAEALQHTVVGVRDAQWLEHRYGRRPGAAYDMFYLRRRWSRRPVGAIVLRRHDLHLEILDLVGPPAAFAALIALARHQAALHRLERVDCWITASQIHWLSDIDPQSFTATPLGITVPANVHTSGPVAELKDRWFLLAGDADFT